MNKDRRKQIQDLITKVTALRDSIDDHENDTKTALDEMLTEAQRVKSDEQDALDNMPANIQESERGQTLQSAIDTLDDAEAGLQEAYDVINGLSETLTDILDKLEQSI